jgi:tRNA A-37 threonylcarbamoyl transferase component Bud32
MKNPSHRSCPKCGAPIATETLQGLCPNCLALVAFEASPSLDQPAASAAGETTVTFQSAARPLLTPNLRYFGDYELLEEIARGGMGVVFKARQVSLNRIVAVKMILSGQLATAADVQRFRAEAEAAANLQHPNIVAIHEVCQHQDQYYFSMDFVHGQNLAQYARDHPLSPVRTAELIKLVAEAIHYAHQRGTVHRDLKPHNVLIDATGQPRITDFGLAKQVEKESHLTHTGTVMGSPSYMPPEQAAGKNDLVGPPSDVYSIGAMLYYLLTGQAPFMAETPLATLRKVMEEEPVAPSKLRPETPPDLETICLKCLEKRQERRYFSARELAEELGRFLRHEPILAKPASTWRKIWSWSLRNPWVIIGAAAAAGVILLGLAYGLWERVKFLEGRAHGETVTETFARFVMVHIEHVDEKNASASNSPMAVFIALTDLQVIMAFALALPGILFARWLRVRRLRGLPVQNLQLVLLAGIGLLLITGGLWSDLNCIRLYVWQRPYFDSFSAFAYYCLSFPLLFCWIGGILIWQALQRQRAHWAGSAGTEEEWLPRQPLHYSIGSFITAIIANLALFVSLSSLGIAAGLFDGGLAAMGISRNSSPFLIICFVWIALTVAMACWVYATRKIYRRRPAVSVFLWVLFGASVMSWFSLPPFSALPTIFILSAIPAGLMGGGMFVKIVKIRKGEPIEPAAPLVLGELFQWDRRAFAATLGATLVALALFAGLLFRSDYGKFLFIGISNTLLPIFLLATRTSTGKLRELFLSILILIIGCGIAPPFAAVTLPMILQGSFKLDPLLHWLAMTLIGVAAGGALIYFGKIRPKAR